MKLSRVLCILVFLLIGVQLFASGTKETTATDYSAYTEPAKLQELIESGEISYLLVDVRTPMEFMDGYIPTAVNIPLDTIGANPPDVPKESLVILYCRSGNRSGQADRILKDLGYEGIVDFGGISKWSYGLAY